MALWPSRTIDVSGSKAKAEGDFEQQMLEERKR